MSPISMYSIDRMYSCIHVQFCSFNQNQKQTSQNLNIFFENHIWSSRFKIIEPSSCNNHVARNINWYNIKSEPLVTHYTAERSTANFQNDSGDSVDIIDPTRKWFRQRARDNRWTNNCYWQSMMVFRCHLLRHSLCNCVRIWMITLNLKIISKLPITFCFVWHSSVCDLYILWIF